MVTSLPSIPVIIRSVLTKLYFFLKAHENDLKVNLISYLSCQGYVFSPLKRSYCQTSASWRLRLVCTTIPPLKYVFLYRDISEILRVSYWLGQSGQDKPQDSFFSLFVNNDPPCWTKDLEPSRHCDHRLAWSSAWPRPQPHCRTLSHHSSPGPLTHGGTLWILFLHSLA